MVRITRSLILQPLNKPVVAKCRNGRNQIFETFSQGSVDQRGTPSAHLRLTMSILWALIIGLIVGVVAKLLMPGRDPGGFIITILLGIGGSLLANWLGHAMGFYRPDEAAGFIASVLGAVILLVLYRLFTRGRTMTP